MNPFRVEIASPDEEDQYVGKFLKILSSLGEHAASYLFQKGVVLGDQSYIDFNRQLSDGKIRDFVINSMLRPGEYKNPDQNHYCLVAILLFTMSKEAAQLYQEVTARPLQTGTRTGIIALGHLMALIDRATAFLSLPSLNDKAYWRLMTLPTPVNVPPAASNPGPPLSQSSTASVSPVTDYAKNAAPKPAPAPAKSSAYKSRPALREPPTRSAPEKPVISPPTLEIPELPPARQPVRPAPIVVRKPEPPQQTSAPKKPVHKKKPKLAPVVEEPSDENKPEGPIKAMLRRIAEEIHDTSYEGVLEAIKDETLMRDLYNTTNNPISVKVTEVDAKERTVYLIKQKRGAPEPVTFRLIRKLLTELFPEDYA